MEHKFPNNVSQSYVSNFKPSKAEMRALLLEMRKVIHCLSEPTFENVTHGIHKQAVQHILSNGMTVGEFCMWCVAMKKDKYKQH